VQLESLYRTTFTTPERWAVELLGRRGTEVQDFLIAEGRVEGRISATLCSPIFVALSRPMMAPPFFCPGMAMRAQLGTGETSSAASRM
jgi:hypothetical protein